MERNKRLKERGWFVALSFIVGVIMYAIIIAGVLVFIDILFNKNP